MKKLILFILLSSCSVFAAGVTYSTSGEFNNLTDTTSTGGSTITFAGIPPSVNVGVPTFSSLGTFVVSSTGTGTFTDSFVLKITQTSPSAGSTSSSTSVDGTITGNSSTILLTFAPSTVTIGGVTYTFMPDSYGLNNPSDNAGRTTIEAYITAVPEPASLGALGGSIFGLGLVIRRRALKK